MLLQPSSPSSFSAFSPSRPTNLSPRACGSMSSATSSSSSPSSPFTSPSRPGPMSSVRRQLDFGGSPVKVGSPSRSSVCGRRAGDQREDPTDMDLDELSTSFKSSAFLNPTQRPHQHDPHSSHSPASPTPSSSRTARPPAATWTLPLASSSSSSSSSTCSPAPPPSSRIPVLVKPPLVRRHAFHPSQAHNSSPAATPSSFIPSYSQRVPAPPPNLNASVPPSGSTSTSIPAHQQIARLRTSVSLSSSQKPAAPTRSPMLSVSLNGGSSTPTYSPTFSEPDDFEDARPSPDAFKVSLMKKSGSTSSAGSLSQSLRKGLISPPTPNAKSPLHFDLSPRLAHAPSSRTKDGLPHNLASTSSASSPASSNSSPTNSFSASPRPSLPRNRTSYFSSSLIGSSSSSLSSSKPLTSSNLSASPTDPHPLRAFTLSRPSALSASSSSGSSTTGRGGWTPVKPTRLFFGPEDDSTEELSAVSQVDEDGSEPTGGRQRRRTNDQPPSEPQQLGLGLGLGLPMELQPARAVSSPTTWRTGWEQYRSPHPQRPSSRRVRTSSGLKRKGSAFSLGGSCTGTGQTEAGPSPFLGRRRSVETEEDVFSNRFQPLEQLGSGDGGVVWKVEERSTGLIAAVKIGRKWGGERERSRLLEELSILQSLSSQPAHEPHPNIIHLTSAWEQSSRLHLHTPLYPLGDLATFLEHLAPQDPPSPACMPYLAVSAGGLDEVRTWKLLASLASALDFAHSLGIVHLDVKPSNVLVDADGEVKLGDWGYSARLKEGASPGGEVMAEREGDRDYLSAEGIRGVVGTAGDIFSLGLLLLEALANIVPPSGGSPFHRLRSNDFSDLESAPSTSISPFPTSPSSPFPTPTSASSIATTTTTSYFSSPPLLTPSTPNSTSTTTSSWGSVEMVTIVKQMMHSEPSFRPSAGQVMLLPPVRRAWDAMEKGRAGEMVAVKGVKAGPTLMAEEGGEFGLGYLLGAGAGEGSVMLMKGLEEGIEGMLGGKGKWEMEC